MNTRPSALAAAERYSLHARILSDPPLTAWFLAICTGKNPPNHIDETMLVLLEAANLVRRTIGYGIVLTAEGRAFARSLGIVPPASEVEIDPNRRITAAPLAREELGRCWRELKVSGDISLRNRLMEHYLPIVKYNAERIHAKLPAHVDIEDLISAGVFGLMDALEAYDPQRGVKFETYCAPRIRGAILDALRSMDWVPRFVRSRLAQAETARAEFQRRYGYNPGDNELAQWMGVSESNIGQVAKRPLGVDFVRFPRMQHDIELNTDASAIRLLEDLRQANPLHEAQKRDLKELITRGLSRAERLIIVLYYMEEMTMREIGLTLDLSESRVSQMHSAMLARLRSSLSSKRNLEGA